VAVEIDGTQHVDAGAYDADRSAFLESLGWQVLRFWNSEVRENADGVADMILATVAVRLGPTHPQPLPSRVGR
jgi:very-short-patch-repair endonuclease